LEILNKVSKAELAEVAKLHVNSLPNDLLPQLGIKYLNHFYSFINKSPHDGLLVGAIDGKIVGSVSYTLRSASFLKRSVINTLSSFSRHFVTRYFNSKKLRIASLNIILSLLSTNKIDLSPELAFIFTDSKFRSMGIGSKLINNLEIVLRKKGLNKYFVKTINSKGNQAIDFYEKNKFTCIGEKSIGKTFYLIFEKTIN